MAGLTHYKYIDALRGFAFLGVLSVHASQQIDRLPGIEIPAAGRFGVQLFFLLSAITLLRSASVRSGKERFPVRNFFVRRFMRIAPLFWFGILFYVLANGRGARHSAPHGIGPLTVLITALFLHGWAPATINSVVPGGWSIAVEMTFYLCLPFLAGQITSLWKACASTFCALLACIALNHLADHFLTPRYPLPEQYLVQDFLTFWFPAQLPVFLMGIVVYHALHNSSVTQFLAQPARPLILLALGIAGLIGLIELNRTEIGLIPIHIYYALAFSMLIVSLAAKPLAILVNPVTCGIGVLSFSCYITHFAVLRLIQFLVKRHYFEFLPPNLVSWGHYCGVWILGLLLTTAASAITYFLIEKKGIKLGSAFIRRYEGERPSGAEIIPS